MTMSSLPWAWILAAVCGLAAMVATFLWGRTKRALSLASTTLAAVSEDPADASTLPTSGALAVHGPSLNKTLNRLRGNHASARLHDQALATMQPERVLEAAALQTESIVEADGLHCGSITCVRFYEDRDRLAQSHSRLPDGTRDMVVLSMREPTELAEAGIQALRYSRGDSLPDYLGNLDHFWDNSEIHHLDVVPLYTAPGGIEVNTAALGVLVLGRLELSPAKLHFETAPSILGLSRSIAHALATCQRKQATERLSSDSLTALARTADATSSYTRGHSERVAKLAVRLAKGLGHIPSELERIHQAALLHDLGSVAVSHRLLDHEDGYDEEQRALMRPHIEIGLSILEPLSAFADVMPVIAQHHEWWNGEGYPHGLSGEDIEPLARVLTVVDVYEALTSTRPYRNALSTERALLHLEERAGSQFEPRVVEEFAKGLRRGLAAS